MRFLVTFSLLSGENRYVMLREKTASFGEKNSYYRVALVTKKWRNPNAYENKSNTQCKQIHVLWIFDNDGKACDCPSIRPSITLAAKPSS